MRALLLLLLAAGSVHTQAAFTEIYSFTGPDGTVPDGDPTGLSQRIQVSSSAIGNIQEVKLTLTLSGGYNGDLYAYLRHGSGFAVLLNRTGRTSQTGAAGAGYSDSGFLVTFADSALNNIHNYQTFVGVGTPTGNWQPDGRNVSPDLVLHTDTPTTPMSTFNSLGANGDWTLFVSDQNRGGGNSTLTDWSLEVSGVPEPVTTALAIFGGVFGVTCLIRRRRGKSAEVSR